MAAPLTQLKREYISNEGALQLMTHPLSSKPCAPDAALTAPGAMKTFINPPQANTMLSHTKHTSLDDAISRERLRQARISFNLMLAATALALTIGTGAALSGNVALGTAVTVIGSGGSIRCAQLNKETNDRLDKFINSNRDNDST